MGISGNILDSNYNQDLDIPNILSEFISQCVASYSINSTACPLAQGSINTTNPADDIISRINAIVKSLSNGATLALENYSILDYSSMLPANLATPPSWPYLAEFYILLEDAIAGRSPVASTDNENEMDTGPMVYNENLTLSSYDQFGPPPYEYNDDIYNAVTCIDGSLENIAT